jgi:hypothetical protein
MGALLSAYVRLIKLRQPEFFEKNFFNIIPSLKRVPTIHESVLL